MRTNFLLFFFALALGAWTGCQTAEAPAVDLEALKADIQAMEDAYAAAENAGDFEALTAYYAEDAQSLPDDEPAVVGRASILERMKNGMEEGEDEGGSIRFETVEVFAAGDLAVEVGRWIGTEANGEEETGKYMAVFEKRDGKYVCIRDIWNSDTDDDDGDAEDATEDIQSDDADEDSGS